MHIIVHCKHSLATAKTGRASKCMWWWVGESLYVFSELDECLHWEEVSSLLFTKHTKGVFFYFLFESQASGQLSFALVKVVLYCNSWFLWRAESANLSFPLSGAFSRMLGVSSSHHYHSVLARTWPGFIQQCSPKLRGTSQMKTLKHL